MSSPLNIPETDLVSRAGILRYLVGSVLGLLLGLALLDGLVRSAAGVAWTPTSQRLFAWVESKREIAAHTAPPRLFLLGGSNVFYGLRAEHLSRELGMPVVNFGTHGAFPAGYLFHEVLAQVKPGDRVLYCPEYVHYSKSPNSLNDETITHLIADGQSYLRSLPALEYAEMLLTLPADNLFARWFHDPGVLERRLARIDAEYQPIISAYGDYSRNRLADLRAREKRNRAALVPFDLARVTSHLAVPGPGVDPFLDRVVRFRDELSEAKAVLLFTWPNTYTGIEKGHPEVERFLTSIRSYLESAGIPVVGDPFSAMYPKDAFFDTVNHLTAEAAEKRTARLVPALREALAAVNAAAEPRP